MKLYSFDQSIILTIVKFIRNHNGRPPKLAVQLFRRYCRPDRLEELEGDLEEFYYLRLKNGESKWKADVHFWWNVFRCYKSYSKTKTQKKVHMISLFKSFFKLALRHSWKNKGPVTVNVVGLGLALSMCMFVYMLYAFNLEFDSFYENTENSYRIHSVTLHNGKEKRNEFSPIALDDKLRNEISGISRVSSYFTERATIKKESEFFTESVGIVSSDFTEMFELPFWYGSFAEFGNQPLVYLTKPLAIKYFGDKFALGEKLTIYLSTENKLEVTVGGVFDRIPANSSFRFQLLISQEDYLRTIDIDPNDWSSDRLVGHYLNFSATQKVKIAETINRYIPRHNNAHKELKIKRFELVPFDAPMPTDLIIGATYVGTRARTEALVVFTTLALTVFLIACFNLANTSMALIARRLKEIGVRRTLGSGKKQILIQFLFEMGIVSLFSFIIALSTANFTSKSIMGLFGSNFLLQDIDLTGIVLFVAGFLVFTTLVAGILPSLYAWKFQPVAIMRKTVRLKGVSWLNKVLTVAQYSFSIAVLIMGVTFSHNADFLSEMDLGYQEEGIIDIPIENEHFMPVKREIDQLPGVMTTGAVNHFGNFGQYGERASLQIDTSIHEVRYYAVGQEYLDLMEIRIASGRSFLGGSSNEKNIILVSQSFANQYFVGQDPLNKVVKINGERKTIVGVTIDVIDDVVKAAELLPTVIALADEENFEHLLVKASIANLNQVEDQLKLIWKKHIDQPYSGVLQEDFALGSAGEESKNLQKIFLVMASLSGFLSLIGIFSLAKLNVAKRIKEISIRKVLGSSLSELLFTINKSFAITLTLALLLGTGLGYFVSNAVLELIYKYHVEASLVTSLLSAGFIIAISTIMISAIAFLPANSNLVDGLRDE